jgi:hypothetical protein
LVIKNFQFSISFRTLVDLYIQTPNQLPKCGSTCHSLLFTPPVPLPRLLRPHLPCSLPSSASRGSRPACRGSGSRALRGTAARNGATRRSRGGGKAGPAARRRSMAGSPARSRGLPMANPALVPSAPGKASAPAPTAPGGDPEALGEACSTRCGGPCSCALSLTLRTCKLAVALAPTAYCFSTADGWGSLSPSLSPSEQAPYERRQVDLATVGVWISLRVRWRTGAVARWGSRTAEEQGISGRGVCRWCESSFRQTARRNRRCMGPTPHQGFQFDAKSVGFPVPAPEGKHGV